MNLYIVTLDVNGLNVPTYMVASNFSRIEDFILNEGAICSKIECIERDIQMLP